MILYAYQKSTRYSLDHNILFFVQDFQEPYQAFDLLYLQMSEKFVQQYLFSLFYRV